MPRLESGNEETPSNIRSLDATEPVLGGCDLSIDEGAVSPGERGLRHRPGAGFDIGRIVYQRIFRQPSPNDGFALNRLGANHALNSVCSLLKV